MSGTWPIQNPHAASRRRCGAALPWAVYAQHAQVTHEGGLVQQQRQVAVAAQAPEPEHRPTLRPHNYGSPQIRQGDDLRRVRTSSCAALRLGIPSVGLRGVVPTPHSKGHVNTSVLCTKQQRVERFNRLSITNILCDRTGDGQATLTHSKTARSATGVEACLGITYVREAQLSPA